MKRLGFMDVKFFLPRITWIQGETLYGKVIVPSKDEELELYFYLYMKVLITTNVNFVTTTDGSPVATPYNTQTTSSFDVLKTQIFPIFCIKTIPTLVNTSSKEKEYIFSFPIPKDFPPSMFHGPATIVHLGKSINIEHRLIAHLGKSGKTVPIPIDIIGQLPTPKPVSYEINSDRTHIQVNLPMNSTGINGTIEGEIKVLKQIKQSNIKAAFAFLVSDENPSTPQPRPNSMVQISDAVELKKPIVGNTYKIRIKFENYQRLFSMLIPNFMNFQGGIKVWVGGGLGFTPHEYVFVPISTGVGSSEALMNLLPTYSSIIDLKPFKSNLEIDSAIKLASTAPIILDQAALTTFNDKVFKKNSGSLLSYKHKATIQFN
jgi:hypothetical protein